MWLDAAANREGRVLRSVVSGHVGEAMTAFALSLRVELLAQRVGLNPATFSSHSLRSGFLTSAAEAGASIWKLAEVSRHKSLDTLRGYVRRVDLLNEHAGSALL